jgi:hypothetical protein
MPSAPIRPHVPQPLDVVHQLPPQIILQRHRAELLRQAPDLPIAQLSDFGGFMDVKFSHEVFANFGSNAVEGGEGAGDEASFVEVDAEDEDLRVSARPLSLPPPCTYHCGEDDGSQRSGADAMMEVQSTSEM